MNEGFTIKCNKCGKEKVFVNGNFYDVDITIEPTSRDGDIDITCNCGNEITN